MDITHMIGTMDRIVKERKLDATATATRGIPSQLAIYEECTSPDATEAHDCWCRVHGFLGLQCQELTATTSHYKKQNKQTQKERLSNYDDVVAALKEHKYEDFLEEEDATKAAQQRKA